MEDVEQIKFLLGRTLSHEKTENIKVNPYIYFYFQAESVYGLLWLRALTMGRFHFDWMKNLTHDLLQTFLEVMIELEKLDSVSPERVELVEDCLRNIGRLDLAKIVAAYRMSGENINWRS